MKIMKLAMLIGFLALGAQNASAGIICSGQISGLAIGPTSGILQTNYGHGWHYLCSFKAEHNGVAPEVCKIWWSMLLSAQSQNKEVQFYYDDSWGDCSNLPNWHTPVPGPYFVNVKN